MPAAEGDAAGSTAALRSAGAHFSSKAASGNRLLCMPGWLVHLTCLCAPESVAVPSHTRAAAAQTFLPAAAMTTHHTYVLPCSLTFWPRLQPRQLFRHGWPQHR